ncbi:hypothetical protein PENSPDRAFT_650309 [Peniophora sp. CONT]|nr:hypothetical protein PENSPDRAFT_650309 [Peniophora sp. CONT]
MPMGIRYLAIQDLPDDVLSYIFNELAQADSPGLLRQDHLEDDRTICYYHLGWITATHICRRWRMLLISLSSLWATVVCKIPPAFEIILERARGAPLTLQITPNHASPEWFTRAHEVALDRIQDLRLLHGFFRPGPLLDQTREIFTHKTLPLLTELEIDFMSEQEAEHITPEGALSLDAPNLKAVSLHGLRGNFTSVHLRSLEFSHYMGAIDSSGHFLRVLRNAPLLEILRFSIDCLPFKQSDLDFDPVEEPVRLVHLKRLCAWRNGDARNVPPNAALFFRHLYIPETCIFHYKDFSDGPQVGWRTAFTSCSDRLRQLPYDALSIHITSMDEEDIACVSVFFMHECPSPLGQKPAPYLEWECCTSPIGSRASSPPAPGVRLLLYGEDEEKWRAEHILPEIATKVQCNFITHLVLDDVNDRVEADVVALASVLRCLHAVTTLFIRFDVNGPGAMRALAIGHDHSVTMPALRDLVVEQVYHSKDEWGNDKLLEWWGSLVVVLERRKEAGNQIRTVRLSGQWVDNPTLVFDRSVEGHCAERVRELVEELCDERIWE